MRTTIRPSVPADAKDIIELLAESGLQPNVELQALNWKYWTRREDYSSARSFVATRGAKVLAHAGAVPGSFVRTSRRYTVLHLIDWAARSTAAGVGVSLMKHVARLADALLAVGGSEQTRQILPHIGFQRCGTADGYVRVLHPLHVTGGSSALSWKLPARLARRALWRLASPIVAPAGWSVSRVAPGGMTVLAEALPRAIAGTEVFERSEGLFRFMLDCPIVPMELYALKDPNEVRGYFLLAFAPGQARIADCWVAADDSGAWQALMHHAAAQAWQRRDVTELVCWSSDEVMTRSLRANGFHHRNQQPIFLRAAGLEEIATRRVRVQMMDNDAAYFYHGFAELWS